MNIDRFENFDIENPFFEERFVFEKSPSDKRPLVASLSSMANPFGKKREADADQKKLSEQELAALRAKQEAERKRAEEKRKAEEAAKRKREQLRGKVGPKPRKETPQETRKGLKKTQERVEKDLDLSKEGLKDYIKGISDALKECPPDKLRDFINAHKLYAGGDHKIWNADLCTTFALKLKAGVAKELEQRRYAAALQIYLGDKLSNKGDIFQANRKKRDTNPFVYIDGYLGGYTISVLAAYWNTRYSKVKKEKLGYANLKPEYGAKRKNQKIYDEAIDYLRKKLGEKSSEVSQKSPKPKSDELVGPPEPTKKLTPEEKARAARLRKIGEQLERGEAEAKAEKAHKDKEWNEAKARIEKRGTHKKNADMLAGNVLFLGNSKLIVLGAARKRQDTAYDIIRNRQLNPDAFKWHERNPFTDHYVRDTWPAKLHKQYKEAYDKAMKSKDNKDWDKAKEILKQLRLSINDYYSEVEKVVKKLQEKYRLRVAILAGLYDLPPKTRILALSPTITEYKSKIDLETGGKQVENPQLTEQKNRVKYEHLKDPKSIDKFYKLYFKFNPKKTYDTWEEMVPDLQSEKKLLESAEFYGLGKRGVVDRINQIILLRNMYKVYWTSEYYRKKFNMELESTLALLDGNHEEYYKNYKVKKDKDFIGDILAGKLKK